MFGNKIQLSEVLPIFQCLPVFAESKGTQSCFAAGELRGAFDLPRHASDGFDITSLQALSKSTSFSLRMLFGFCEKHWSRFSVVITVVNVWSRRESEGAHVCSGSANKASK